MKIRAYLSVIACTVVLYSCSNKENSLNFGTDSDNIALAAEGGKRIVNIASQDNWVATSNEPWITISPANGRGSVSCQIMVDSALTDKTRTGTVRIQNQSTWDNKEIIIEQKGFDYGIALDKTNVEIDNYAAYGKRYFDVKVNTNVDFDIEIPASAENWLKYEKPKVDFDRGLRPREVVIRFNWGVNSQPAVRPADVIFKPKSEVTLTRHDQLSVSQKAAEAIPENTRQGDSIALLAIARSLGMWSFDWEGSGERMDNWGNVQLWEEGMPNYTKAKEGRVRFASFYLLSTKEGIPFEVQYLTAAEQLRFQSNINTFRLNLETGEYITKLPHLKRLTITAFGLVKLHPDFVNLKELVSLDLSLNNFQKIPEMLTPENFPKLRCLELTSNQRSSIYDLSNTVLTNFGGLYDETEFPTRMLEWGLDSLCLSFNFLHGSIPTFEETKYPKYTEEEVIASDSLPRALIGKAKIMTESSMLSLNLNRLTGTLPDWLLYHPMLNYWYPLLMVFPQEGRTTQGRMAGFSNAPLKMDYYYDAYPTKKRPSDTPDETE